MEVVTERHGFEAPEQLVTGLVNRLRQHALWDALLIFSAPLIVAIHCVTSLYRDGWIDEGVFVVAALAAAGLTLAIVRYRYRSALPSVRLAARLIDERAGAADRFLTLSTVEPLSCPPSLLGRLRSEAAGFLRSVRITDDFPYRVKRSFYRSLLASILFAGLFHLLLPLAPSRSGATAVPDRLRDIAAKMTQRPRMNAIARDLQILAAKLEDVHASRQEKETGVQEMQKKIQQEQNKEEQKDNRDLLNQAASALGGAEQQPGDGEPQEKKSDGGGGEIQSNSPENGKGEAKSSTGSGDGKSDGAVKLNKDMQNGKPSAGDPKEQSKDTNQQKAGEGKGDHPDPSKTGGEQTQELSGKMQAEREQKSGNSKAPGERPEGAPPAERFNRPGQGSGGIKDPGYVTVRLPEEVAGDSKGATGGSKETKNNSVGPKSSVSNVPLPAHLPDAPTEKQQVPLEYRGIIR